MVKVNYRGYTAQEFAGRMSIIDWNGDVVFSKMYWKYARSKDVERYLKEEVDRFLVLAPVKGLSWWA